MPDVGIVTGAASGIGAACAQHLAGTVDVLLLADRNEVTMPGGESVSVDITDAKALAHLADVAAGHGTLRKVVHAAGISPTMGDWRRILDVDLVGTALLIEALRPLTGPGTAIVCISSMSAHLIPAPDPAVDAVLDDPRAVGFFEAFPAVAGDDPGTAYSFAKRGVQRLVRREAVALGAVGARICSVAPGLIDTPMGRQEFEQQPAMKHLEAMTPLGRTGRPDELAAVAAFLVSDDASFVSGIDVLVDGGVCAALAQHPTSSN